MEVVRSKESVNGHTVLIRSSVRKRPHGRLNRICYDNITMNLQVEKFEESAAYITGSTSRPMAKFGIRSDEPSSYVII
jgi:hypothetical protein